MLKLLESTGITSDVLGWVNYLMKNNSVEYVNNVVGRRFVEYHGVASSWELLLAQGRVPGNTLVKYMTRVNLMF